MDTSGEASARKRESASGLCEGKSRRSGSVGGKAARDGARGDSSGAGNRGRRSGKRGDYFGPRRIDLARAKRWACVAGAAAADEGDLRGGIGRRDAWRDLRMRRRKGSAEKKRCVWRRLAGRRIAWRRHRAGLNLRRCKSLRAADRSSAAGLIIRGSAAGRARCSRRYFAGATMPGIHCTALS